MRLNKFLAERLGISRRDADNLINSGRVKIDGVTAELGMQVLETQDILVDNKKVDFSHQYSYLMLNKPRGYVSSRKQQGNTPTLYELLPEKWQALKTVGRLDKDSSGLILLTDDGNFAFEMTHPRFFKIKTYIVELDHAIAPLHQQMISDIGITLPDGVSKLFLTKLPDKNGQITGKNLQVEMSEGRNRQIRRTFAALGYEVTALHRVEFGKYQLGDLKPGQYLEVKK